jgi:hypothetical protein
MRGIRHNPGSGATPEQASPTRPGTVSAWSKSLALEDRIFAERRLLIYGSGVLIAYALGVLVSWRRYRGVWAVLPDGSLSNIDFCWIWVSGKFAASSDPSWIYDHSVYAAAQDIYYPPSECLFMHQYIYPPTFLFFSYPLGLMPYLLAFTIWVIATLLLYEATVWMVIPRAEAVVAAITTAAAVKNIQLGHTGFLVAALIGLSLVFAERRPWVSGIFLGLLTCKPQSGFSSQLRFWHRAVGVLSPAQPQRVSYWVQRRLSLLVLMDGRPLSIPCSIATQV